MASDKISQPQSQGPLIAVLHPMDGLLPPNPMEKGLYHLQSYVLLFDALAVPLGLSQPGPVNPLYAPFVTEAEWLIERGVLLDLADLPGFDVRYQNWVKRDRRRLRVDIFEAFDPYGPFTSPGARKKVAALRYIWLRGLSEIATDLGYRGVPLYRSPEHFEREFEAGLTALLRVVLERIPIPSPGSTAWEDLIAFKQLKESQAELRKLHQWLARLGQHVEITPATQASFAQELDDLLASRIRRMKAHRIRVTFASLEAVVPLAVSAALQLTGAEPQMLKWAASLTGAIGVIRGLRTSLELRTAEHSSDAVAYIISASRQFSKV